jgi:hypothetical protein
MPSPSLHQLTWYLPLNLSILIPGIYCSHDYIIIIVIALNSVVPYLNYVFLYLKLFAFALLFETLDIFLYLLLELHVQVVSLIRVHQLQIGLPRFQRC